MTLDSEALFAKELYDLLAMLEVVSPTSSGDGNQGQMQEGGRLLSGRHPKGEVSQKQRQE